MPEYSDAITERDKRIFKDLIEKTRVCMGSELRTSDDGLECETAYLSDSDGFTYHTHPNGTPYPSDVDKVTTAKWKKRFLIIGLVPTNEVVVYSAKDGFTKMVGRFHL